MSDLGDKIDYWCGGRNLHVVYWRGWESRYENESSSEEAKEREVAMQKRPMWQPSLPSEH